MIKNHQSQQNEFDGLYTELSEVTYMYQGLNILKNFLKPQGVGQLSYGFMLHQKSHLRGDLIQYTTFAKEIRRIGAQDGGAITYRFGDIVPHMTEPLFVDMKMVLTDESPLFSHNKSFQIIYDSGYRYAWLMPFLQEVKNGHGFLMAFQDSAPQSPEMDVNQLSHFGPFYHKAMIQHKQMARHFQLTEKQSQALANTAKGLTAGYLAERLAISERSVELRLQKARKKLHAKTTAEAVYKALAYGILPLA